MMRIIDRWAEGNRAKAEGKATIGRGCLVVQRWSFEGENERVEELGWEVDGLVPEVVERAGSSSQTRLKLPRSQ